MTKKRNISILGSTGSIGTQTLDVIGLLPDLFDINYLTTDSRINVLQEQIKRFHPYGIVITNYNAYKEFKSTSDFQGNILFGEEGLIEAASDKSNDLIVSSLVGFAGVTPTLSAICNGINVALANKETLVSAGSVIISEAKKNNVEIIAIDSEHSAILQCLVGEDINQIEKLILTASGGPFRNIPLSEFDGITVEQALAHPNWTMGQKITIDSATMMNKGFEVIEAYWLFDIPYDRIEVVIHPQSIVHSFVQFVDGSVKAQLGKPDMKIPISYALTYPSRHKYNFDRLELTSGELNFYLPDFERYPCLQLAYDALKTNGTAPAILNAANEVAVDAFLNRKIKFTDIPSIIERSLSSIQTVGEPDIETIIETDKETRLFVQSFLSV